MTCALMPSRRKMCAKLCITVVVPAPEEPVTAMIGCFTDMWGFLEPTPGRASARGSRQRLGPEQRALVEERRDVRPVRAALVLGVVALDALHLVARAEDQRHALMKRERIHLHEALAAGRRATPGLLHQQADGIGRLASRVSFGYMNTPPRIRMRCTSATSEAIQRMLKSRQRMPDLPAWHSLT